MGKSQGKLIPDKYELGTIKMNREYQEILPEVLEKFKPISGKLDHKIRSDSNGQIVSISIEIETNEFEYNDPFYGKIKANQYLREFANIELDLIKKKYNSIKDLENQTLIAQHNEISGWFSNSLEVITTKIEFKEISNNNTIQTSIIFFLTKSDSYPLLKGEIEEHKKYLGNISIDLSLGSLLFLDKRKDKTNRLEKYLNTDIYDLTSERETNLYASEEWYKYLRIELK